MNTSYFTVCTEVEIIHNDENTLTELIETLKKYDYILEKKEQYNKKNGVQKVFLFRKDIDLDYLEDLDRVVRKELKDIIPNIDDFQIGNIKQIDFIGKIKPKI